MPTVADFYGTSHWGTAFDVVDADHPSGHRGFDINGWPEGTEIPAIFSGYVVLNDFNGALGNMLSIRRTDGVIFGHSHMKDPSPLAVGAPVLQGQPVGELGNTGTATTGAHLHLTFSTSSINPASGAVIDPEPYIVAAIGGDPGPGIALGNLYVHPTTGRVYRIV